MGLLFLSPLSCASIKAHVRVFRSIFSSRRRVWLSRKAESHVFAALLAREDDPDLADEDLRHGLVSGGLPHHLHALSASRHLSEGARELLGRVVSRADVEAAVVLQLPPAGRHHQPGPLRQAVVPAPLEALHQAHGAHRALRAQVVADAEALPGLVLALHLAELGAPEGRAERGQAQGQEVASPAEVAPELDVDAAEATPLSA